MCAAYLNGIKTFDLQRTLVARFSQASAVFGERVGAIPARWRVSYFSSGS